MTNPMQCRYFDQKSKLCKHKAIYGKPCPINLGRAEDMCPNSVGYQRDQDLQNEDCGER